MITNVIEYNQNSSRLNCNAYQWVGIEKNFKINCVLTNDGSIYTGKFLEPREFNF